MKKENIDVNSLAHTKWNCKYHIVFAPKYRRKVFYEEKRLEIREILRQLCQWKGVEIIEGEVCPDHIHKRVALTITNGIPDESKMRKGDLMYFRGTNNARTEGVGHVEMYIGNGQCFGHGSGIGGTVKNMRDYCRMRYNQKSTAKLKNKGLICVIRFIPDDVKTEVPKDLTTVNDIVWELEHRGILTNKALWLKKLDEDENAYYLAKGCVNYIRHMGKIPSRTAPELESINDIVWELEHRGILTQKDYWLKKLKNDTNSYWLARKCCDYIRRAE